MIPRILENKIKDMAKKFPVITLTGTRQCGKSTILKECFPNYEYLSLEDPDVREFAENDPRGFLKAYPDNVILDEAQRAPELFSYIQTVVDASRECGRYILSGSHNFLLMEKVSQSLAGRCAVLKLEPFSIQELDQEGCLPETIWEQMLYGGYPRLYDKKISPQDYFPSYVATYVERDVRSVLNVTNSAAFIRFVRLCAARSGQVLNMTELAASAGISVPTANHWMSVLEQSYLVYRIMPYYKNFSKRLVKAPKLYFGDVGLLCYLLGIETVEQLQTSDHKGSIFETMIVSEYRKSRLFAGRNADYFYWRDTNGNEIALLTESAEELHAYEIKLAETMNTKYLRTLHKFGEWSDTPEERLTCVYTGKTIKTERGNFIHYKDLWH